MVIGIPELSGSERFRLGQAALAREGLVAAVRAAPGVVVRQVAGSALAEIAGVRGGLAAADARDLLDGVAVAGRSVQDVAFGRELAALGERELPAEWAVDDPEADPLVRALAVERALLERGVPAEEAELARTLVLARGTGLDVAFCWFDGARGEAMVDGGIRAAELRFRIGRASRCRAELLGAAEALEVAERQAAVLLEVALAGRVRPERVARLLGVEPSVAVEEGRYLQRTALLKREVPDRGHWVAGPRFPAEAARRGRATSPWW
ncbi:hypothetical protein [Kitasatospora sp. NPDC088134]|uniref:hypothetical protein n=1 Tax=Kitasatospora sp. NPDC088134 TaxID=3364071 RepID=UPI00380DDEC4